MSEHEPGYFDTPEGAAGSEKTESSASAVERLVMYGLIWKLRYVYHMNTMFGWWLTPRGYKLAWQSACASAENIDYDYREYTPKECVIEEISCWYD